MKKWQIVLALLNLITFTQGLVLSECGKYSTHGCGVWKGTDQSFHLDPVEQGMLIPTQMYENGFGDPSLFKNEKRETLKEQISRVEALSKLLGLCEDAGIAARNVKRVPLLRFVVNHALRSSKRFTLQQRENRLRPRSRKASYKAFVESISQLQDSLTKCLLENSLIHGSSRANIARQAQILRFG
ncbi:uncharacterized protein LOC111701131 [Eurytemora carolleeae]|uniref:uncharacterized protein LOC111701131 n=1 Tax=Eurytemora carolleeae TaxID=1294199 RepID=UPI000C7596FC|nr:uncharacterized protein LOC111701131 [Eurytemora carolleeae]|eukprot:XP_023328063.1 uncharacterized protein LOC111701131 [Eurytemora affinis]